MTAWAMLDRAWDVADANVAQDPAMGTRNRDMPWERSHKEAHCTCS